MARTRRPRLNLPFDKPLSVSVVDSQGTPVSGKDVLFTAPGSGPSLAFTGGISQLTVATNGNGIAASSTLTANAQLGAYTVTAQLIENPALSGTFSLRNIAWYVSPSGNDANSCSSPAQPCAHINQAIGKAQAGDVILVAGGEYFVNLADVDRTQVIKIDKSITLVGGWNSSFTAQNGISIVNGEAARRGVNITAGTAKLNRFLIKNGMTGAYGGGVYAAGNASLALMNSTVQSSKADYGGGVYASQLTLENSTISNNVASSMAAACTPTASCLAITIRSLSTAPGWEAACMSREMQA